MSERYDIAIIGGGMVGATLACALEGTGLRAALIEGAPPPAFSPEQPRDLRVSAVSIASVSILDSVGAWAGVVARRCCPFRRMRVWEDRGDVLFASEDIHEEVLGYIVENRVLQLALIDRLPALSGVDFLCPAKTHQIDYGPQGSRIELEDGRVVEARLLAAADGGQSQARQAAGMGVSSWDYEHHALVLTVETAYPQQDITWQRFTPHGPQAFLPLDGRNASLVWYEAPERVKRLLSLPDEALLGELSREFPAELGEIKSIVSRGFFPLRRQHALRYYKEGAVLVGDAAHMIHPLAGQGVNIGLLDAAALAEVLAKARRAGRDIGSSAVLREYESMRRNSNLLMMTAMDFFYRAFGNANVPLRFVRNLGLGLAERITPAKKLVMRYAMGLDGSLPKLARGEGLGG
jgi:2-octaprenyl-3-methyl-6-methoxy-1,4-benzoquinol hydroxylase